MKKLIWTLISVFLLLSLFALGFFVKKSIDDNKIDALLNTKLMLDNKNEKFAEELINLKGIINKSKKEINTTNIDNPKNIDITHTTHGYKNSEIIMLNDLLYAKDSSTNWENLSRNNKGEVLYNNKVILTEDGRPINDETAAESVYWLKILVLASGAIPRENCDVNDTINNGILGCYVYEDEE